VEPEAGEAAFGAVTGEALLLQNLAELGRLRQGEEREKEETQSH
jgi:hypothetical protein